MNGRKQKGTKAEGYEGKKVRRQKGKEARG